MFIRTEVLMAIIMKAHQVLHQADLHLQAAHLQVVVHQAAHHQVLVHLALLQHLMNRF